MNRPPLLVYNRLTTVLSGNPTPPHSPSLSQHSKKMSPQTSAESKTGPPSIWFEYGCV